MSVRPTRQNFSYLTFIVDSYSRRIGSVRAAAPDRLWVADITFLDRVDDLPEERMLES